MIRQFFLINSNGETYDLNATSSFLSKLAGLGSDHNVTYEQVGNQFVTVQDLIRQKTITGELFLDTYEKYRDFVRFAEIKPLTLMYVTDDTYYIDVNMDRIEKKEMEIGGLYCRIRLVASSQYYKNFSEKSTPDASSGKKYNFSYPYTYTNDAASTISINTESMMDAPVRLSIYGPSVNPSWIHSVDGSVIATGKVNVTIPDGKKVVVDATKIPYTIKMMDRDNTNVEDVYQNSDFSTKRFILLKNGNNIIRTSHESGEEIKIIIERRELYETV